MNQTPGFNPQQPELPHIDPLDPLDPSQPSEGINGKDKIVQAAEKALPPETIPSQTDTGDGWWSWIWGKGKKEEPKIEDGDDVIRGEKDAPLGDEDASISTQSDDEEEFFSGESDDEDLYLESKGRETDDDASLDSIEEKEPVEETLVKTYQAAQETTWQYYAGKLGNLAAWAASPGVRVYADRYKGGVDKEKSIAEAKKEMLEQLHDPQFVELFDMAKTVAGPAVKDQLDSFEGKTDVITTSYILPNRQLIVDLLEINLARGFANLARQVSENKDHIPNYDKQPTFVSVLSLLSQKAGTHIDAKTLSDLELKYKDTRKALRDQIQVLFPGIDQKPDVEEAVHKYINEYIKSKDDDRKDEIKEALFPNLHSNSTTVQEYKAMQAFFKILDTLHARDEEFHQLFALVSDDILLNLFPNKFSDMELPGVLQYAWVQDWIFNSFAKDLLASFLQESFDSLENDSVRNEAWEYDLQTRVGAPDLMTIVQAPSALLVAFAKNYIQSDPKAMQLVAQSIDSMIHPLPADIVQKRLNGIKDLVKDNTNDKKLIDSIESEVKKVGVKDQDQDILIRDLRNLSSRLDSFETKLAPSLTDKLKFELKELIKSVRESKNKATKPDEKILLNQLSQEQLANWLIESAQAMLNTDDPNLAGLGKFIKQGVNNLALALMAKGAKIVIPEDEAIEPSEFVKEFSDRIVEKFNSTKNEKVTDQFWKDFVKDLPVPSFVKNLLVPNLTGQSKSLQKTLQSPDLKAIQDMHAEAETKILSYDGGEQLLSITEKVSDQIIEQVLEQNIGLVSTLGLGDTIEELFAQYLPDVTINDDLKNWFKDNVSALGVTEQGESPQSIVLLKQGIQAVLRRAMVDTIERNFKNNSKDYAAQLLNNFHQSFENAFAGFDAAERKKIDRALEIQADIDEKNASIAQVKQKILISLLNPLVENIVPNAKTEELSKSLAILIEASGQKEVSEKDVLVALKKYVKTSNKTEQDALEQQSKSLTVEVNQIKLNSKPVGLEQGQMSLIEDVLHANIRYVRATSYADSLTEKRDELIAKLNEGYMDAPWTAELLPLVNEALILRNMEAPGYKTVDDFLQSVSLKIEEYKVAQVDRDLNDFEMDDFDQRQLLKTLLEMSSDELKTLSEAIHTNITLQHAQRQLAHLEGELDLKEDAVEQFDVNQIKDASAWENAKDWMEQVMESRETINELSKEVAGLQKELDVQLETFQALAGELTALLGLDQKERLDLPPYLQDTVWPYIEAAKKTQIARLLFAQISPLLVSIDDIQKNQDKLKQIAKGDSFLGQLIHASAEEVISRIPEFLTSYKPFARQILTIMGAQDPTDDEIDNMEDALHQLLIGLGKKGVAASMLKPLVEGFVPVAEEDDLSQDLTVLINQPDQIEISKQDVLDLLKLKVLTANKKEERKLEKQAEALTKSVNQFLLNRGKSNLKPEDVIVAYLGQIGEGQLDIDPEEEALVVNDLISDGVVEKIKAVVITPEEIAQSLNDTIPGATDLHSLIAPQLQAVIVGDDATFQENREELQRFLEGTILRLFVKIAEANQGKDVLAVLTQKLKDLAQNAKPVEGKLVEEVAREMIDKVLEDVLGIASLQDLDSVPPAVRKLAYDKVKEQAYQQLTPLVSVIIEANQSRTELKDLSGSNFLGNLCQALSNDVFTLMQVGVNNYRSIAGELLNVLAGQAPTDAEIDGFANAITKLVKEKNLKNSSLVQAYVKVVNQDLGPKDEAELRAKLEEQKAKDKIRSILITPEEIAASIGKAAPHLDANMQKSLANELQRFFHESPAVYKNISDFAGAYIEGVLLKVFVGVAKKNPKQAGKNQEVGKDTLIVLTEKFIDLAAAKYQEIKNGKKVEDVTQEFNDAIMKDLLGIDSPNAFKGLPDGLKVKIYDAIKNQLGGMLLGIHASLSTAESSAAKAPTKAIEGQLEIADGTIQILSEDIANMVMASLPQVLTEQAGEQMKMVVKVSTNIESTIEELARGNLGVAKVLLQYARGDQFQKMLGNHLNTLADKEKLVDDKQKAAGLISNLLLNPMSQVIEQAINFENEKGAQFNQQLVANFLKVGAGHLRNVNAARKLAAQNGRNNLSHQDFVQAAGDSLHPAVPKEPISYQKSIEVINQKLYGKLSLEQQQASGKVYGKLTPEQVEIWEQEQGNVRQLMAKMFKDEAVESSKTMTLNDFIQEFEKIHLRVTGKELTKSQRNSLKAPDGKGFTLRELIRQDSMQPVLQRQKEAYDPAIKALAKMLFPNGKNDLTFLPEELRGTVWKAFKKNMLPNVLPMITEAVLDPAMLNSIVLGVLESTRDTLSGPIVLEDHPKPDPLDLTNGELDQATGEFIFEVLGTMTLPDWMKSFVLDAEKKGTSDSMKKSLGASLRKQFNDTFIQDKLKMALEQSIQRINPATGAVDAAGKPRLKFDTRDKAIKQAEAVANAKKTQEGIKRVSREVVGASISYGIRSTWASAQQSFDKLVEKAFGKVGRKLKQALDAVFGFIFFKIVGTILSVLFWPTKQLVKEMIYKIISLDTNLDSLLGIFTKVPDGQPLTGTNSNIYPVYNEDLIFKIGAALNQTVQEFLEEEPILPNLDGQKA